MEQWWRLLLESNFDKMNPDLQQHIYYSFYRFAYNEIFFLIRDHALSEDIIQEAFLKVTAKHHQLHNIDSAKHWVKRVIRNQIIDTLRKNHRGVSIENVYDGNRVSATSEIPDTVENTVEDSLRNQLLREAILELKPDYHTLLLKYYIEEKSHKELAAELVVSEQVIAQRLVRARKKLLIQFSKKWANDTE